LNQKQLIYEPKYTLNRLKPNLFYKKSSFLNKKQSSTTY